LNLVALVPQGYSGLLSAEAFANRMRDSRGTLFCLSKIKYPNKKTPTTAYSPHFLTHFGGNRKLANKNQLAQAADCRNLQSASINAGAVGWDEKSKAG